MPGRTFVVGIADTELALLVEQDSLLQAVLEFMNYRERHVTMVSKLMTELKNVADENGLLKATTRKWPGASWVFSQRLREAKSILNRLGIVLTSRHTKQGTEVTLENLDPSKTSDAPSVTESPSASPPNLQPVEDLGATDASVSHQDDSLTDEDLAIIEELNQTKAVRKESEPTANTTPSQGKGTQS